jgi:signal peptidase II
MQPNLRTILRFLAVAFFAVFIDQLSKMIVLESFTPGEVRRIIPGFFNLTLHFNPGAAFGMLANLSEGTRQIVLGATTLAALGFVFYLLFRDYLKDWAGQVALALIVGGAFGNIIDRLRLGQVVDFLDFYFRQFHWWTFNLADSCICLGVFLLLVRRPKGDAPPQS